MVGKTPSATCPPYSADGYGAYAHSPARKNAEKRGKTGHIGKPETSPFMRAHHHIFEPNQPQSSLCEMPSGEPETTSNAKGSETRSSMFADGQLAAELNQIQAADGEQATLPADHASGINGINIEPMLRAG
jgi:hypothetical protein